MTNSQAAAHFASLPPETDAYVRVFHPDAVEVPLQRLDRLSLDELRPTGRGDLYRAYDAEQLNGDVAVHVS